MTGRAAMRVLVTRPAAQSQEWLRRLHAAGIDAVALPLISIAPLADLAPLHAAWPGLAQRRMLMFVSPNAAEQFFAARPAGAAWPAGLIAASPGPGTTRALQSLGVPAAQIVAPALEAPQFDSEALWARLSAMPWQGAEVLIVRGESGRDWLAQRLRDSGARVDELAVYRRGAPVWDDAEQRICAEALQDPRGHLWWFSSSEAIDRLAERAAGDWPAARALATHPRIAARARHLGFGEVLQARPTADDVMAAIRRSLQSRPL